MHYSNMHVKKISWHKDIHDQDNNSVTCAMYIHSSFHCKLPD